MMDIKSTKIDHNLKEIGSTMLCELPQKAPWTVEEFIQKTKVSTYTFLIDMIDITISSESCQSLFTGLRLMVQTQSLLSVFIKTNLDFPRVLIVFISCHDSTSVVYNILFSPYLGTDSGKSWQV